MKSDGIPLPSGTEGLLPGERLLWAGRRARLRWSNGEKLILLYLLVAVPLILVGWFWQQLRQDAAPAFETVIAALVAAQWLGYVWYLLVVVPGNRRAEVYRITDLRVMATTGRLRPYTVSAWLYQIRQPEVRGSVQEADLLFQPDSAGVRTAFRTLFTTGSQGRSRPRATFPVFRTLADAETAREIALTARRELLSGSVDVPAGLRAAADADLPAPPEIQLAPGERVLWTGGPGHAPWWFGPTDRFQSAAAALFCTVAWAGGLTAVLGYDAPPPMLVPVLGVGGIALYLAVGRVLLRRRRGVGCRYVLTDRRLISSWRGRRPTCFGSALEDCFPPDAVDGVLLARPTSSARSRRSSLSDAAWPFVPGQSPALAALADPESARVAIAAAQLAAWRTRQTAAPTNG